MIGAAPATAWDAHAPAHLRAATLLPGARSLLVVGSAGRRLWDAFRAAGRHHGEHPLDEFVSRALVDAEAVFHERGIAARRFEASVTFQPRVDFRALGRIAGLGGVGPFGLLIHPVHGPWFGLRGAWLLDVTLPLPASEGSPPCAGCSAPCVGDAGTTPLGGATAAMRTRCPIGSASRYSDEQLNYHHEGTRPPWFSR